MATKERKITDKDIPTLVDFVHHRHGLFVEMPIAPEKVELTESDIEQIVAETTGASSEQVQKIVADIKSGTLDSYEKMKTGYVNQPIKSNTTANIMNEKTSLNTAAPIYLGLLAAGGLALFGHIGLTGKMPICVQDNVPIVQTVKTAAEKEMDDLYFQINTCSYILCQGDMGITQSTFFPQTLKEHKVSLGYGKAMIGSIADCCKDKPGTYDLLRAAETYLDYVAGHDCREQGLKVLQEIRDQTFEARKTRSSLERSDLGAKMVNVEELDSRCNMTPHQAIYWGIKNLMMKGYDKNHRGELR